MSFGQFAATTQFYLYGKKYCTATGYEDAVRNDYKGDILKEEGLDLSQRVFMITGANGGLGKEMASFLASKGGTIYMICRNKERATKAQEEIVASSGNSKVFTLIGDCGLEADVRRVWDEFTVHAQQEQHINSPALPRLDALVCNAGALLHDRTLTSEGIEVTFATHLLFGVYLLGSLAMPTLKETKESRLVLVSSGGMYNTKFPKWETAMAVGDKKYAGQMAYAYAKRGQVLLAEKWAEMIEKEDSARGPKVVSCHPGWTLTDGVEGAYGEQKKYLEPLRTLWQGADGIVWLCVAPTAEIEGGGFYLDRTPRRKHIAGPFFTEGSFTKNTPEQVDAFMRNLDMWSNVGGNTRPTAEQQARAAALRRPLVASDKPITVDAYMGTWHVLANIPSYLEVGAVDCYERYAWNDRKKCIDGAFDYTTPGSKAASHMTMTFTVSNGPDTNTHWKMNPNVLGLNLPLGLDYLLLDHDFDPATGRAPTYAVVGTTDRSLLWIMIRKRPRDMAQCRPAKDVYQLPVPDKGDMYPAEAAAAAVANSADDAGAEGSGVEASVEMATEAFEQAIMRKTFALAHNLGFDCNLIQRVGWSPASSCAAAAAAN